ncbi:MULTISPECIES: type I restriction endonuclease [unclassified Planococcus (in: firmicutes)]|uniref:type I restriction endonuclease n=1 Tax=unclassified Planococcus (in: firmicutes) TaxID=2662419 RepID=UPI000C7A7DA2|nr:MULTISPECIES: type I restriction endonuclease [unclassified Planococcus (in: firmicutes)]PKG46521.1 hypothetical protein CXF66_06500 [Planococcus sp. Urea-trap-24]PKG89793.1 hypothetical protein CXF91_06305 [Planococcus sp. Urea-3u-39]
MSKIIHNEDSRVKIPVLLHFLRLGYHYQTKKGVYIDKRNNIFVDVFKKSIREINKIEYEDSILDNLIKEIAELTDNSIDKGKAFYERITRYHSIKLIDLETPENNDFRVVSELSYQKGIVSPFRPDITILINGIPMGFLEVKKPNNPRGIPEEFSRMKARMAISDFKHFFNQMQILGFSNNMSYNDNEKVKLQGSFYTTPNGEKTSFNNFREEKEIGISEYISESDIVTVLSDNNVLAIKDTPEFQTNLRVNSEANRFATSLFSKQRIIFLIKYGIVFLDSPRDGFDKHIMRYPQFFAILKMLEDLERGMKRGVLWHTQGSGKTALSYFASNVLRDYYSKKNVVTKFFFIVDRLDLLNQASVEFASRGMSIANINTREDFTRNIKSSVITSSGTPGGSYKETMNVVNIQKFSDDSTVDNEIDQNIQRIYFLDEVHRGYKPSGTFLANLIGSDPDALFIGLTGTPILKEKFKTTDLFNGYIHKYYYNKSIADGYTLKIKKENISTQFRSNVKELLKIEENKKIPSKEWQVISKAPEFVEHFCNYIVEDFLQFKEYTKNSSVGFMIVSSSSEQARRIQEWFTNEGVLKTALILYDEENNKKEQEDFRGTKNKNTGAIESKYDGVIVFNMLLTGFDAPRLKRLYLMREIKEHSLLQTLSRVNRPYEGLDYGYVVDFVDITEEYEETNRRYLEEIRADLQLDADLGIEDIFVDTEEIKKKLRLIENQLFAYSFDNLEEFTGQIEHLEEKTLREVKGFLGEYKDCYNELRIGHVDVSDIPIERISKAYIEVSNRVNLKVLERMIDRGDDQVADFDLSGLFIEFLKGLTIDIDFTTENDVLDRVNNIQNAFSANTDKKDTNYIKIREKYQDLLKRFKDHTKTVAEVKEILMEMEALTNELLILNSKDNVMTSKYKGELAYMRVHKRLSTSYSGKLNDIEIFKIMRELITEIEEIGGRMHKPNLKAIERDLRRPISIAFKKFEIALDPKEIDHILGQLIEERFMGGATI